MAVIEALLGDEVGFAQASDAVGFRRGGFLLLDGADGGEEGFEVGVKVVRVDAKVPVKEEEELFLHEVDFGEGEAEGFVAFDRSVARPVLVLGGGVVEVLGGEDEGGEEDAVDGATHAFGDWGKALLQAGEIDKGAHQGGDLDMGAVDQGLNEDL